MANKYYRRPKPFDEEIFDEGFGAVGTLLASDAGPSDAASASDAAGVTEVNALTKTEMNPVNPVMP